MTPEEFEQAIFKIMDPVSTMTLATCRDNSPWATDVYFAAEGFNLVFFSSPNSRHCRNLAVNPACSATIHPVADAWQEIKGLQIEGEAEPISGMSGKATALAAYLQKFPFAHGLLANPAETVRSINKAALYVLRPSRILYLDNSLGFGARHCADIVDGRIKGLPVKEKSN